MTRVTVMAWSPTRGERPTRRCSRPRSATTSQRPWRRTPSVRHSSRSPRADAGPGPSSTATSTPSRAGWSRPGSRSATGSAYGHPTAPSGRSRSTPRRKPASCWSTSTRRTAPTSSPTPSTSPACGCCSQRAASRPATTARWSSEVRADCPGLERAVYVDTDDWADLVAGGADLPAAALAERSARLSPDDPINIQYTSGTTGYPKGATLSHRNILNNGYFTTETIGLTHEDRLCIPVPFYHCFGMVMANLGCTSHGATMVIPAPGLRPGADPAGGPGRALHRALRRTDDVHRHAERRRASPTTTSPACAAASWPARSARSR